MIPAAALDFEMFSTLIEGSFKRKEIFFSERSDSLGRESAFKEKEERSAWKFGLTRSDWSAAQSSTWIAAFLSSFPLAAEEEAANLGVELTPAAPPDGVISMTVATHSIALLT